MSDNQNFPTQRFSLEEDTITRIIKRYEDQTSINLIKSKSNCLASTFSLICKSQFKK